MKYSTYIRECKFTYLCLTFNSYAYLSNRKVFFGYSYVHIWHMARVVKSSQKNVP